MKIKKNNTMATQLPGALALAAAGAATQANAATVQITFTGSYVSSTGSDHLDTDFGDDGTTDLRGQWGGYDVRATLYFMSGLASVWVAAARRGMFGSISLNFPGGDFGNFSGDATRRKAIPVTFSDMAIRGGAVTSGYLDLTVSHSAGVNSVTVNRLIFDAETGGAIADVDVGTTYATYGAVPEPSGLALLALGAGGLLARRRRAMAA